MIIHIFSFFPHQPNIDRNGRVQRDSPDGGKLREHAGEQKAAVGAVLDKFQDRIQLAAAHDNIGGDPLVGEADV